MNYKKHEAISLKAHPNYDEQWLKDVIIKDTSILGLGQRLEVKHSELIQPKGGTENYKQITADEFFKKLPKEIVHLAKEYFDIVKEIDPSLSQTFTQNYTGLQKGNRKNNFLVVRPKQTFIKPEVCLSNIDEWAEKLSEKEIDIVNKDHRSSRIIFRLTKKDIENNRDLLKDMIKQSYDEWFK